MEKTSIYVLPDIISDFQSRPDIILNGGESEGDQLLKTPHASVTPSAPPLEEVAVNSETSWTEENSSVLKSSNDQKKSKKKTDDQWYRPCGKGACWWPPLLLMWLLFAALAPLICLLWLFCSMLRDADYDDDDD